MAQSNNRIKKIEIGSIFGDLTVTGNPFRHCTGKTTRAMFPCKCKCGKETHITGSQLRSGKRTRCTDCAYRERPQSTMRLSNIERLYNLSIVARCKKGNIENSLSIEDYADIISKNCYYCGVEPRHIDHLTKNRIALREDLFANGVDRIDSSRGYSKENCVACCKQCNTMKMDYSFDDFLNKIKVIYKRWEKHEDIIKEK